MTATAPAILLVGGNPTEEHPLLAWQIAHQCAAEQGAALCCESTDDQAGAAGEGGAGRAAGGYADLTAYLAGTTPR